MKILLTGAGGFIGSAFAQLCVTRGHRVAGLLLPREQPPALAAEPDKFVSLRGTLSDAPWADIERFGADACVHAAWITTPGVYLEAPENYGFLEDSFSFLQRVVHLGTTQLLALGTCIEYRITDSPLSEANTPVEPTTTYARCKNELRLRLERDAVRGGMQFAWARVFYPYGPGEHPSRLCSSLIDKLGRGNKVELRTPQSTKDYIYIADLASALLTILETHSSGAINVGTGAGITVHQIASTLEELMGKTGLVHYASPPEHDPFPSVVADAGRLRSLGWRPETDLRTGLRRLLAAKGFHDRN